jgi:hypothetical protein
MAVANLGMHEDREEVREAQKRVEAKARLEKGEALVIIGLLIVITALLMSHFL